MVTPQVRTSFQVLPAEQRRLLRLMQDLNFGQISGLAVRRGEPDFSTGCRTIRRIKLAGADHGPRPELAAGDFELRKEHLTLLDEMSRVPDGTRLSIEIKHGLPFLIEIEQDCTP